MIIKQFTVKPVQKILAILEEGQYMIIHANLKSVCQEEKIFKELICIIIGKTAPPLGGLIYLRRKFVIALLVVGH